MVEILSPDTCDIFFNVVVIIASVLKYNNREKMYTANVCDNIFANVCSELLVYVVLYVFRKYSFTLTFKGHAEAFVIECFTFVYMFHR